jgi:hypothetical protein
VRLYFSLETASARPNRLCSLFCTNGGPLCRSVGFFLASHEWVGRPRSRPLVTCPTRFRWDANPAIRRVKVAFLVGSLSAAVSSVSSRIRMIIFWNWRRHCVGKTRNMKNVDWLEDFSFLDWFLFVVFLINSFFTKTYLFKTTRSIKLITTSRNRRCPLSHTIKVACFGGNKSAVSIYDVVIYQTVNKPSCQTDKGKLSCT